MYHLLVKNKKVSYYLLTLVKYVISYVPGEEAPIFIFPELGFKLIPAKLDVNVPPEVPIIVGVGFELSAQYLLEE